MLLRDINDLNYYNYNESRYIFGMAIARKWFTIINKMNEN